MPNATAHAAALAHNASLRTGDLRICPVAAGDWIVWNPLTGTTTVAMPLRSARRVLRAAQR